MLPDAAHGGDDMTMTLAQHGGLAWAQLFGELDRSGLALHLQIRRTIVAAVEDRTLAPDARLPSTRQLAALLGVARNTIVAAYEQLTDEGFIVARERSGIFVAPDCPQARGSVRVAARNAAPAASCGWSARFAVRPSRLPQITKPRDWLAYPYPFLFGQFDPTLFPTNAWRESVRAASSATGINDWAGDLIDGDDPELIAQLRLHVLPRRGILAAADEIMITIGSQQALSMLAELLVGPGTRAAVEDPCYPDTRNMLRMRTAQLTGLAVDAHGAVPSGLADRDVAFLTVGHQCPTTAVMPLERRRALLDAARDGDVVLVEDDYEADLGAPGEAGIPSLKGLDTDGRVVYVGSFSKVLAPGLRLGYVVAPRAVIAELRSLRRLMLRHPPSNNQRAVAMFIALGHYRAHLRRMGTVLAERAERVSACLAALMPQCRWRCDPGATSFWVEGPPGLDARALTDAAQGAGVLIEPGDIFFADAQAGAHCFRLGFTSIRTDRIESGLRRLAALLPSASAPGRLRERA